MRGGIGPHSQKFIQPTAFQGLLHNHSEKRERAPLSTYCTMCSGSTRAPSTNAPSVKCQKRAYLRNKHTNKKSSSSSLSNFRLWLIGIAVSTQHRECEKDKDPLLGNRKKEQLAFHTLSRILFGKIYCTV